MGKKVKEVSFEKWDDISFDTSCHLEGEFLSSVSTIQVLLICMILCERILSLMLQNRSTHDHPPIRRPIRRPIRKKTRTCQTQRQPPLPSTRANTATYECRRLFLTVSLFFYYNFHLMQADAPQSNGPKVREPYPKDCMKADVLEFTPPG